MCVCVLVVCAPEKCGLARCLTNHELGAWLLQLGVWCAKFIKPSLHPYNWSSPPLGHLSSGEGGQMCSSRHNFAATPHFPDLSTPLESLIFSYYVFRFRIGAVVGRKYRKNRMSGSNSAHHFPHTCLHLRKIEPHFMCGFGLWKPCH